MHYFLTDLLGVLIVLGTLVFVHEFGHYAAAKFFGVRVEVFSLGFGKRLLGFKRGDTDYRLSVLPFGGYVRMTGENPMEERTGDPGEFASHPRWQRFIIALAGPAMNVLLAIVVVTGIFMVTYSGFRTNPGIIGFVEPNSAAAKAGLQAGDQITAVDRSKTPDWETLLDKVMLDGDHSAALTVQRGSQTLYLQIPVKFSSDQSPFEALGLYPEQKNIITNVEPGLPAAQAGIQPNDEVVAVNGSAIHSFPGLIDYLQNNKDNPISVQVQRGSQLLSFALKPQLTQVAGQPQYRIGIESKPIAEAGLPFSKAVHESLIENERSSLLIFDVLGRLLRHQVSIKQMSGPVGIAQGSGQALRDGPLDFLSAMAIISLNLGIFNLLPIPILDGGLILLLLVEGVIRRDIKQEVKEWVYQAAFVFLVLFAVVVVYNDIAKTTLGTHLHLP